MAEAHWRQYRARESILKHLSEDGWPQGSRKGRGAQPGKSGWLTGREDEHVYKAFSQEKHNVSTKSTKSHILCLFRHALTWDNVGSVSQSNLTRARCTEAMFELFWNQMCICVCRISNRHFIWKKVHENLLYPKQHCTIGQTLTHTCQSWVVHEE